MRQAPRQFCSEYLFYAAVSVNIRKPTDPEKRTSGMSQTEVPVKGPGQRVKLVQEPREEQYSASVSRCALFPNAVSLPIFLNHSHGRLDKTPGAIALRLRWYGPGDPKLVFVERKTHNEKWTGEVSVKERFTVDASEVPLLLTGKYPIAKKKKEMIEKGSTQQEVEEWETLVRECIQVIISKQLVRVRSVWYAR